MAGGIMNASRAMVSVGTEMKLIPKALMGVASQQKSSLDPFMKGMAALNPAVSNAQPAAIPPPATMNAVAKVGNAFGGVKSKAMQALSTGVSQFAAMGPQMALMAVVVQPLMAGLSALLEPFSLLSGLFEAYGAILSQAFYPIIMMIMDLGIAFIPVLQMLTPILTLIVNLFFTFSGVGFVINILQGLVPLLTALGPIFQLVGELLNAVITPFLNILGQIWNLFAELITRTEGFRNAIQAAIDVLKDSVEAVEEWGSGVVDFFQGEGKYFDE